MATIQTRVVWLLADGRRAVIAEADFDPALHGLAPDPVDDLRQAAESLAAGLADAATGAQVLAVALSDLPAVEPAQLATPEPEPEPVDLQPGDIASMSAPAALALIAAAETVDELANFEAAERANQKRPGGRKTLLLAIEERFTALGNEG